MALRLSGDGSLNLSDVTLDNVTASGLSASGTVSLPSTTSIGNVSDTEIAFVDGVTSALQTQLNAKANLSAGYQYVRTLYITSNATFEKGFALKLANPSSNEATPWLRAIRVRLVGGGGGGGGCATTSASQVAFGGTGGCGGYAESFITDISGLSASVTVTVGSGGTGGSAGANAGGTGGATSFGSAVAANGGLAVFGGFGAAATPPHFVPGSNGNFGTAGQVILSGGAGRFSIGTSVNEILIGGSGSSGIGGNTGGRTLFQTGNAGATGANYGGGGTGGANCLSQGTARAGGAGAPGIVIVELYA